MIIINKIAFGLIVITMSFVAYGKPRIVVSATPIASIVQMLTGDFAEVISINTGDGCPHHYHAMPSDREKFQGADLVLYIDDSFDIYMSKMLENYSGAWIKISVIPGIKMKNPNEEINWHFWLDLDNVLLVLDVLAEKIKIECPEIASQVFKNLAKSKEKIFELASLKKSVLQNLNEVVLLSNSLEHFFNDIDIKIVKLYQRENPSLKFLNSLETALANDSKQCLVIDQSQVADSYKRFNKMIIQLNSENWAANKEIKNNENLFYTRYLEMVNKLKECH